jgi:hypothetical protein
VQCAALSAAAAAAAAKVSYPKNFSLEINIHAAHKSD